MSEQPLIRPSGTFSPREKEVGGTTRATRVPLPGRERWPEGPVRDLELGDTVPDRLTEIARTLRRNQTEAERKLWARLRDRRLGGIKFRRQQPVGSYVADFLCEAAMLIVEVDGSQHDDSEARAKDEQRAAALRKLGYEVVRVWNSDVDHNLHGVLEGILATATSRLSPSSAPSGHLLPKGEGSDVAAASKTTTKTNAND